MALHELNSAVLFTPGRASYVTTGPSSEYELTLRPASQHRAETAADLFDLNLHELALFAGGYPGLAEQWPQEQIDGIETNEAELMANVFKARLKATRTYPGAVAPHVATQGDSNNSIGDVRLSIERGLLKADDF